MEQVELKLDAGSIEQAIAAALKEMTSIWGLPGKEKLKVTGSVEKSFADCQSRQGLVTTAEALECFFIPYDSVFGIRDAFWSGEIVDLEMIRQGIEFLVEGSKSDKENDGRNKLSGTPYINFKTIAETGELSGISRNFDFLDAGCFVLCALLDAKAISAERKVMIESGKLPPDTSEILNPKLLEALDQRITDCLKLILDADCGPGKGWAYTDDPLETQKIDQLYFTWNALESLEVLLAYLSDSPDIVPNKAKELLVSRAKAADAAAAVRQLFAEKRAYLSATFVNGEKKELDILSRKIDWGAEDSNWYYNIFAIQSLMITGAAESTDLGKAVAIVLSAWAEGKGVRKIENEDYGEFEIAGNAFQSAKKTWSERSFHALLLKVLSVCKMSGSKNFDLLFSSSQGPYQDWEQLLCQAISRLGSFRLTHPLYQNVWDKQRNEYSIYYTERAIEALAKLYVTQFPTRKPQRYHAAQPRGAAPDSEKPSSAGSPVIVKIDASVISEQLLRQADEMLQKRIEEIFADDSAVRQVIENLLRARVDAWISEHLSYAKDNMPSGEDKRRSNHLVQPLARTATVLESFIREAVTKHMAEYLALGIKTVGDQIALPKRISLRKLQMEIADALKYIARMSGEEDPQIDFPETLSKILELKSTKTKITED